MNPIDGVLSSNELERDAFALARAAELQLAEALDLMAQDFLRRAVIADLEPDFHWRTLRIERLGRFRRVLAGGRASRKVLKRHRGYEVKVRYHRYYASALGPDPVSVTVCVEAVCGQLLHIAFHGDFSFPAIVEPLHKRWRSYFDPASPGMWALQRDDVLEAFSTAFARTLDGL